MSERLPPDALRRLLDIGGETEPAPEIVAGRYRVIREIGRGGMGVVYEAEDEKLHRRVALKMLADSGASTELRRRFEREARASAKLNHPNVAAVHDATSEYIAMQLVRGGPISGEAGQDVRRLVSLVRDAALAVQHAHEQGIVHRDLKPSNLLVEGDRVFVVDFGLAKEVLGDFALSATGSFLGTPVFMAPEQVEGRKPEIDARTDVYGLGATLHACVTGRPPFPDTDLPALLRKIVEDDASRLGVDSDLDTIVAKCLDKDPRRRYATAADLAHDLDRWLRGEPILAKAPSTADRIRKYLHRRKSLVRVALVAALLAVVGTAALTVPKLLRESAARRAAGEALVLAGRVDTILADAEARRRVGELGEANRLLEQGIRECDAFVDRHDVARGHVLRGRLLRARGRRDAARAAFDRALALDPTTEGARVQRGFLLVDDDPAQAREDLRYAASDASLRAIDRLFAQAERARLDGDLPLARRLLEQTCREDRAHIQALLALSKVAIAQGDDESALRCALQATALQQTGAPEVSR